MSTNPVSHGSVRVHRVRPSSCRPSGTQRGCPNRVVQPQHPGGLGLAELGDAAGDHRPLHRRPRHPVGRSDLGLVAPVLHRDRQRRPQPARGPRPRRHLTDLLGERSTLTARGAAPPAALTPLRQREPPTDREVPRPVSTQSLPEVDRCPHPGQRAASGSSVTTCTTVTPAEERTTRSTARPSSPNKHLASSLRSTTARGSPLAAPEHSEDHRAAGRPRSARRTTPTSGCPVKIEEPDTASRRSGAGRGGGRPACRAVSRSITRIRCCRVGGSSGLTDRGW